MQTWLSQSIVKLIETISESHRLLYSRRILLSWIEKCRTKVDLICQRILRSFLVAGSYLLQLFGAQVSSRSDTILEGKKCSWKEDVEPIRTTVGTCRERSSLRCSYIWRWEMHAFRHDQYKVENASHCRRKVVEKKSRTVLVGQHYFRVDWYTCIAREIYNSVPNANLSPKRDIEQNGKTVFDGACSDHIESDGQGETKLRKVEAFLGNKNVAENYILINSFWAVRKTGSGKISSLS